MIPDRTITLVERPWTLCNWAEGRMQDALKEAGIILVNGSIVVKTWGRRAGIPLDTILLSDGSVMNTGYWYAPSAENQREILEAFFRGETNINLPASEWSLLGPVESHRHEVTGEKVIADELLAMAREVASQLPPHGPDLIAGMSRRDYALKKGEGYGNMLSSSRR